MNGDDLVGFYEQNAEELHNKFIEQLELVDEFNRFLEEEYNDSMSTWADALADASKEVTK